MHRIKSFLSFFSLLFLCTLHASHLIDPLNDLIHLSEWYEFLFCLLNWPYRLWCRTIIHKNQETFWVDRGWKLCCMMLCFGQKLIRVPLLCICFFSLIPSIISFLPFHEFWMCTWIFYLCVCWGESLEMRQREARCDRQRQKASKLMETRKRRDTNLRWQRKKKERHLNWQAVHLVISQLKETERLEELRVEKPFKFRSREMEEFECMNHCHCHHYHQ